MDTSLLLALTLAVLLGGALLVAACPWRPSTGSRITAAVAVTAGVTCALTALPPLLSRTPVRFTWLPGPLMTDLPAAFALRVDTLSAIFLLLLAVVPALAAIYAIGFFALRTGPEVRRFGSLFLTWIAAMTLVVTADDWVFFLLGWETMSLASYLLMLFDWHQERNVTAAWVYLVTTHVAGAGILLGAVALSITSGSFAISGGALAAALTHHPVLGQAVICLFFVGFATKAAVWPFSFWLPEAYRAAPAPAAGLFSGLMAKMGIYGLIRLFLFMMPVGGATPLVWGLALATFGALSMLVGNIRCLGEVEAKRLVAQSSIGQIGYIVLGLGMTVALGATAPLLAAIAFAGALFHVINHATFKPLLFLTVGEIERRTGTHDLRRLGGLIRWMPTTAAATLVGALAIAGTPPLNGFASKWLLYQASLFGGMRLPVLALYGILAIFLSTVSLAAYLKYFGTAFLGEGSTEDAPAPAAGSMAFGQWVLVGLVLLLGLWPQPVVAGAVSVLNDSIGGFIYQAAGLSSPGLSAPAMLGSVLGSGLYQPLGVLLALLIAATAVALLRGATSVPVVRREVWYGGEALAPAETRYGAAQLYAPLLARFGLLLRALWRPQFRPPTWISRLIDLDRYLTEPVAGGFLAMSGLLGRLHKGRVRGAMAWQLITVLLVVAVLAGLEGGRRW